MKNILTNLSTDRFYSLDQYAPNFQYFGLLTNKRFTLKLEDNTIVNDTLYEGYGEFSKQGKILSNVKEFKLYDTNQL